MNVTHYVVVPFDRNEEGDLTAGLAVEALNASAAERGARSLALMHAGAVAFSRTGDPSIGDFQDAVILAQFGEVDLNALSEGGSPGFARQCPIVFGPSLGRQLRQRLAARDKGRSGGNLEIST